MAFAILKYFVFVMQIKLVVVWYRGQFSSLVVASWSTCVSSVVGLPRAHRERKETRKTSALAKKSTTMCSCSRVVKKMKSENVNILKNHQKSYFSETEAKQEFNLKKLQSFLSNDESVLTSKKTLASIATFLLSYIS